MVIGKPVARIIFRNDEAHGGAALGTILRNCGKEFDTTQVYEMTVDNVLSKKTITLTPIGKSVVSFLGPNEEGNISGLTWNWEIGHLLGEGGAEMFYTEEEFKKLCERE